MDHPLPVYLGEDVFQDLAAELRKQPLPALLVADENTYRACGELVEEAARRAGRRLERLVLPAQPRPAADEHSVLRCLRALDGQAWTLIAVGSGTITDIVRFVGFEARLPFLSVPTAASVDAYSSFTAAITIEQIKYSLPTKTAEAVFAHLPTLCAAPARLTAAGFGDMLAKFPALADWQLAHLLTDEAYDEAVARRARQAAEACAAQAQAVRAGAPQGLAALMEGLIASGHCMAAVKSSRPAAGSEHCLSHYWEATHPATRAATHPPVSLFEPLHGEKTGVGAVLSSWLYAKLRQLSRDELRRRLERFSLPDPQQEMERIRAAFGPAASAQVLANRTSLLGKLRQQSEQIKARLLAHWESVQTIAAAVPPPDTLAGWLESAGALSRPAQLHLSAEAVQLALRYAMYVRDRLTILELNRMLELAEPDLYWHKLPA
jgi:glycerol-1-phosphate dehydrogenase [NAD(P)+]